MVSKPLLFEESKEWLSQDPLPEEGKEKLQCYAQRFVMECEAIGSTKQTNGFIKDFNINVTQRANSFLEQLCLDSEILYRAVTTPSELAVLLRQDGFDGNDFIDKRLPFAYFHFSPKPIVAEHVSSLKEFRKGEAKKTGKAKQNRRTFYRIDCLLRHLRNAIAHGQYAYRRFGDEDVFWAFQDCNGNGVVTFRMLVTEELLDGWMKLLYARDKRYRIHK